MKRRAKADTSVDRRVNTGAAVMTNLKSRWLARTGLSATLAAVVCLAAPAPARADEQTVKLIQLLIQKGILTPGQAKDLIRETATPAKRRAPARPAPAEEADGAAAAPAATPGQIRVTYVPQFIRKQIADEVRAQVLNEAQAEGWAAPNALPEWTRRFKLYGDLRLRYQADLFDDTNYNQFINFNAINTGQPFDYSNYRQGALTSNNPPFLNTTQNRNRYRLRMRIGTEIYLDDWVTANVRIATGSDNSPVSQNQNLGQPGDFTKYALWLDRAYFDLKPTKDLQILAGRTPTPFLPSDLMFYSGLNFDGISAHYTHSFNDHWRVFGTIGGFPILNTALDFSTNSQQKFGSRDAYLGALQAGVEWKLRPDVKATFAAGIFDFWGVQGPVSAPCAQQPGTAVQFVCDTDNARTGFTQFGNSLIPLRNIVPNGDPNPPNPQYFGLASRFNVLDIHPSVLIASYHPFDIKVEGQYLKNLDFDRQGIIRRGPPNEVKGPVNNIGNNGLFVGGDTGYMGKVTVGNLDIHKLWDWNAYVTYRYLESDATLDAIADAEFHLGGTNARGYILAGNLGIAKDTFVGLRWLSADTVSGPQYRTDSLYLELQSNF